jgi:ribosomal protein S20
MMAVTKEGGACALKQFEQLVEKTGPKFVSRVLTEELIKVDKTLKTVSDKTDYSKLRYPEIRKQVDTLSQEAVSSAYAGDVDTAGRKFAEAVKIVDVGVRDGILASNILRDIANVQRDVGMEKGAKDTEALITQICIS